MCVGFGAAATAAAAATITKRSSVLNIGECVYDAYRASGESSVADRPIVCQARPRRTFAAVDSAVAVSLVSCDQRPVPAGLRMAQFWRQGPQNHEGTLGHQA